MKRFQSPIGALCVAAASLCATAVAAHHSAAVFYLVDKQITVEGVVTSFTLGNPHARIYMNVKGPNGEEQQWLAEGGSRTVLLRNGWTGDEVKVGDRVIIIGNPSRDGSNVVHWQKLMLGDGRELWGEDTPTESEIEALRHRSK
jgi:hypothetical protein